MPDHTDVSLYGHVLEDCNLALATALQHHLKFWSAGPVGKGAPPRKPGHLSSIAGIHGRVEGENKVIL